MSEARNESSDIAVSVRGVSKYFPPTKGQGSIKQLFVSAFKGREVTEKGYWALKGVDFTVKKGEFFGIVGRNGSGKSTLLKMIAGVYSPTKGSICVNGKLVPFIELGVGFNPELSGRDNVFLNGALLGFSRKEMTSMYDEIVEFAELAEHMDVKLKNYSSGMHVRLAFSIAVRAKADILLIDEVLAVGDAAFQQKCFNYFEDLRKHHKTVIFVSHDMNSVRRFCNRAIYISEGTMTHEGSPESIVEEYVEKNISDTEATNENVAGLDTSKAGIKTAIKRTNTGHVLIIDFTASTKEKLFIGLSVMKDGYVLGEITTEKAMILCESGKVEYNIEHDAFNAGSYMIQASLFKLENRELIAVSMNLHAFVVKGSDVSRGGAMRLHDGWKET